MSLEEDFNFRKETMANVNNLLEDLSENKQNIESIVVGVLFNDGVYRLSHIGNIVDRYGLLELLKSDLNEFRVQLEKGE